MSDIVTPAMVERRLYDLSKEVDTANTELGMAEAQYLTAKAKYEVEMARSRLENAYKSAPNGKNYTVGEREDLALVANASLHMEMATAEITVRASRANAQRVRTQVDLARSIGTSVRTSMEV